MSIHEFVLGLCRFGLFASSIHKQILLIEYAQNIMKNSKSTKSIPKNSHFVYNQQNRFSEHP